jgi:hypothetical protein
MEKVNLTNLIKLILVYEVLFILINLLFEPFVYQFSGVLNLQALLIWALCVPVAFILVYVILKWKS